MTEGVLAAMEVGVSALENESAVAGKDEDASRVGSVVVVESKIV